MLDAINMEVFIMSFVKQLILISGVIFLMRFGLKGPELMYREYFVSIYDNSIVQLLGELVSDESSRQQETLFGVLCI